MFANPEYRLKGNALVVIPDPDTPRLKWERRYSRSKMVDSLGAMGFTVTACASSGEGVAALQTTKFDLVVAEFDIADAWDLCAAVVRLRRQGLSDAGVFFLPPAMDFSYGPPESKEAFSCPHTFMATPFGPGELIVNMRWFRELKT